MTAELLIWSYVLIQLSLSEDLATESSSDGLGFVICSYVLLSGVSILEVLFAESASDGLGMVIYSYVLI